MVVTGKELYLDSIADNITKYNSDRNSDQVVACKIYISNYTLPSGTDSNTYSQKEKISHLTSEKLILYGESIVNTHNPFYLCCKIPFGSPKRKKIK